MTFLYKVVENAKKSYWHDSLIVFAKMSGWIGGPIVVALFLGKWLDTKFGTAPFLFLGTIAVAFLVSSLGIAREARRYMTNITTTKSEKNGIDNTNNTTH